MLTILHHLGLGDAIMLNGMVRHFAEKDDVCIFIQKQHEDSVRFMYRDLTNIKIKLLNTTDAQEMWSQVEGQILPLATYKLPNQHWDFATNGPLSEMVNWAHSIYIQAGIPPKYMYSKFKVVRDRDSEIKYEHDDYVFIHDDVSRGMKIDTSHTNTYRVTRDRLDSNSNIFDYLTVIENASEVHCMDSCYAWMINMMEIGNPSKNFLHLNVKGNYTHRMVKTVFGDDLWTYV
tara:strand:- start:1725 stop:2420 length:696 start_codon:yes stop_codon:yes gene_type:complete